MSDETQPDLSKVSTAASLQVPGENLQALSEGGSLRPPFSARRTFSQRILRRHRSKIDTGAGPENEPGEGRPALALRKTLSNIDVNDEYINPLEQSARWMLSARAGAIRAGANIGFGIMNRAAINPTRTVWLDSTLGPAKGRKKIEVKVWDPKQKPQASSSRETSPDVRRPAVINFHGGGFVVGSATDDALWAGAVMKSIDAVVFSVEYRLAPEHPFPKAVEDCADAILQIVQKSDEFGIDSDRIIVSGFSAGGTLSLASWVLLQEPQRWGYDIRGEPPKIAGFALFYPLLDWTISRPHKRMSCVKPDVTLSKNLTDLFDASYVFPKIPKTARDDPRLSPGLMSDELVECLPPIHLCVCEYDMLHAEGHTFADRVYQAGRDIKVRVVKEAKHAWDKPPPMWPKASVSVEYGHAVESMRSWVRLPGLKRASSTVSEVIKKAEDAIEEQRPEDKTPEEKADFTNSDLQIS
ncbi:putative Alpha/beta hydrolase fold-3 domain-containing protein [Seiridium unicorne]|uniref:Alpha/beta hydrolase fold-3 domain-containing protein n=1 Tax=Seiridium unicorne TaxID=138068 RepID=A0ABR2UHQ5_9PEZI